MTINQIHVNMNKKAAFEKKQQTFTLMRHKHNIKRVSVVQLRANTRTHTHTYT